MEPLGARWETGDRIQIPLSEREPGSQTGERGQSLVELAVSLVILFILLAGVVDFGRAFFSYLSLRDAAQEGAVYGSICPTNTAKILARVRGASNTPVDLSDTSHVQVDCAFVIGGSEVACSGTPMPGNGIKVRVTYDNFPITMPFLGGIIGTQTLTLRAEATDTILRTSCP